MLFFLLFFHEKNYFQTEQKFKQEFSLWVLKPPFNQCLHCCNLLITSIMLAAFIMLALVIFAYSQAVGWITLAFICVYCIVYLVMWCKKFLER
jgi:hypothetical protein